MNKRIRLFCIVTWLCSAMVVWRPVPVDAADSEFKPFLTISEEFNDNIEEVPTNRRNDFITRVQPGASFRYLSPFWAWNASYNFDYRNYARGSRGDEFNHNANLTGNITLLDNFLFLDLSDSYRRVTLDVARDAATESSLFLNQTDQNTAIISPYLLWRPGEKTTLKTGYRYNDTRFWGSGIERSEQGAFADLNHEVTSKFSLSTNYGFTHLESEPTRYNKHDLSGGFRYEHADNSFVYGQVGNSWQQFDNGGSASYLFWNAGITHDLGFAMATLETRVQTAIDPLAVSTKETSYSGRLEKTLQRGMIGFSASYFEYEDTQANSGNRSRLTINGNGRYEVLQDLTASLSAAFDQFSQQTSSDYPYRFTAVGGLSYALKDDLTLGLTYTYVTYLTDQDTTVGSKEINRAVVEVRKGF